MKKKDIKELQRIHESIPKELSSKLMKNVKVTPTISKVVKMALKSEDLDPEKRDAMQALLDSGRLDVTEQETNKKVEKAIDEYVMEEMRKSVLAGRLTPPKNDTLLGKYIKKCRKNKTSI